MMTISKNALFIFSIAITTTSCQLMNGGRKPEDNQLVRYRTQIAEQGRSYWVYEPQEAGTHKAVVLIFHGSNGDGASFSQSINFNEVAKREGYLVVYPDALVGNWAEGCGCNNADRLEVKDLEFVSTILDEVDEQYLIDNNNIYGVGFSQGGLFAGRLACEMSGVFKGIMIAAANMSVPLSQTCAPQEYIPITIAQGALDNILPYTGSDNGDLSLLSAKETAAFWADKNNSSKEPKVTFRPDSSDKQVEVTTYSGNEENGFTDVTLFSIIGFGHFWPRTEYLNMNEEIATLINTYKSK